MERADLDPHSFTVCDYLHQGFVLDIRKELGLSYFLPISTCKFPWKSESLGIFP